VAIKQQQAHHAGSSRNNTVGYSGVNPVAVVPEPAHSGLSRPKLFNYWKVSSFWGCIHSYCGVCFILVLFFYIVLLVVLFVWCLFGVYLVFVWCLFGVLCAQYICTCFRAIRSAVVCCVMLLVLIIKMDLVSLVTSITPSFIELPQRTTTNNENRFYCLRSKQSIILHSGDIIVHFVRMVAQMRVVLFVRYV